MFKGMKNKIFLSLLKKKKKKTGYVNILLV